MISPWSLLPLRSCKACWTSSSCRPMHRNGDTLFWFFHPGKTKIMVFGCRHPPPSRWKLGSDTVEVVDQHLHLGILHSSKGTIARTIMQTRRGRSFFFALNRFGARFGCTHHSQPWGSIKPFAYLACCMVHRCGTSPILKWKCMKRCIGRFSGQFKDYQ